LLEIHFDGQKAVKASDLFGIGLMKNWGIRTVVKQSNTKDRCSFYLRVSVLKSKNSGFVFFLSLMFGNFRYILFYFKANNMLTEK